MSALGSYSYMMALFCLLDFSVKKIYNYIEENKLFDAADVYNVNIPASVRGIKITKQGSPYFDDGFKPLGNDTYIQTGERVADECPTDLSRDTVAIEAGYVTLTPLTLNRTDFSALEKLEKLKVKS